MMTNVIDTEKLGSYIVELKNLHTEWSAKKVTIPDVGECGGSTIIQIEEMGKQYQKMQEAFVLLLENTISYMEQRKSSVETKEKTHSETFSSWEEKESMGIRKCSGIFHRKQKKS